MSGIGPVVVRNPLVLRIAAIPLTLFAFGGWAGVVSLWSGAATGVGLVGRILLGLLLLIFAIFCTNAVVVGSLMKETFGPDAITVRVWFRSRRIPMAQAQAIRQQRISARVGITRVPFGRLQILGPGSGLGSRAILDETMSHHDRAIEVLDSWVRARPELVAEDAAARAIFVARGVLAG